MFSFRNFVFPDNKELRCSLQHMKGVGFWKSFFICAKTGIAFPFFIFNLNYYFFFILSFLFKRYVIHVDNVKRKFWRWRKTLLSFRSWRALRHRDYLPVNGQRTRSNAGVRRREKVFILSAQEQKEREQKEKEQKRKEQLARER